MNEFISSRDIIAECASGLAAGAPTGWHRIVFYVEFLRVDGDIDQQSITSCIDDSGREMDYLRAAHIEPPLRHLFEQQSQNESCWTSLLLSVRRSGEYSSRLYYGPPPGLSGDEVVANARIDDALSEQ